MKVVEQAVNEMIKAGGSCNNMSCGTCFRVFKGGPLPRSLCNLTNDERVIIAEQALRISNDLESKTKELSPSQNMLKNLDLIVDEYKNSCAKHDQEFNTTHEGYAVLKEELEELWEDIKKDNWENMEIEAAQVGAMALKFLCSLPKIRVKYEEK